MALRPAEFSLRFTSHHINKSNIPRALKISVISTFFGGHHSFSKVPVTKGSQDDFR